MTRRNLLKSQRIGRGFIGLLWLGLGLAAFSLFLSFMKVATTSVYYGTLEEMVSYAGALFGWGRFVVLLLWVYWLHSDLGALFEEYPIASGEALGRLLFPIVNIWGVWNVFATLADRLKREGSALAHLGTSLRSWLLWLYVAWGVDAVLMVAAIGQPFKQPFYARQGIAAIFSLAAPAVGLFQAVVYLQMARIIHSAIAGRSHMQRGSEA